MTRQGTETSPSANDSALEPLFRPWEEPDRHRVRGDENGLFLPQPHRRPSPLPLVDSLRAVVKEWREANYPGASDTTRTLLSHWFDQPHLIPGPANTQTEFRYHFCQREAVETFIHLMEVRPLRSLAALLSEHGGFRAETVSQGINPDDDRWARHAFKIATGAGKTKCMSLAIVWSYFHALKEAGSPMPRHFVVIAPNLTVFERLKEDFLPETGGPDIFTRDPLIPKEWAGDWNLSVILQDESGSANTPGVLYLTNIHRLFEPRTGGRDTEAPPWAGPRVPRTVHDKDTELRDRIASHKRVMILNDEAHHVWDPGSAWSNAIEWLHDSLTERGGPGIVAQLDFSATPKDNEGRPFRHIVCDTPLGEAIDAGIVKTPIIGRASRLVEQEHEDASVRYETHLVLGYKRWQASSAEWSGSGKKPLLFVMCKDTRSADQIAHRLNQDNAFSDLNGKTINLHTNLKGKIKRRKIGGSRVEVFEESEREISDEDLRALRKISRELDSSENRYSCVVSVLMLREGWDVRNVTTIVPLRSYSSDAGILPEQTLGRGLRRMTPPGDANEVLVIIEHPAFSNLYSRELEQEGVAIDVRPVEEISTHTVTIFPDGRKDLDALDIAVPSLGRAHWVKTEIENLSAEDVRNAAARLVRLPFDGEGITNIEYEGRHLITGEIVERMSVNLALLQNGYTAISFFVRELEMICRVQNMHAMLAPLLQMTIECLMFDKRVNLGDPGVGQRLAGPDAREYIRALFVPLIIDRTVMKRERGKWGEPMRLRDWKPYQVTMSERHPAVPAARTLFNLVPCDSFLEVAMSTLLCEAPDVAAFAKNAGPQALRIDYRTSSGHIANYVPDFFVRTRGGEHALVETKGFRDPEARSKAIAAIEWCREASARKTRWRYVFVTSRVMTELTGAHFSDVVRVSKSLLADLVNSPAPTLDLPNFEDGGGADAEGIFPGEDLTLLSERSRRAAENAVELFRYFRQKKGTPNLSPVFSVLLAPLEEAAFVAITRRMRHRMPTDREKMDGWFNPDLGNVPHQKEGHYHAMSNNLKRGLVYNNPHSVVELLRSCLDLALNDRTRVAGVFDAVREAFGFKGAKSVLEIVSEVSDFRSKHVGLAGEPLTDKQAVSQNLRTWVRVIGLLERDGDKADETE